jgi:hypothetical protein
MIHPHTELRFIDDSIGHGVVATQFIPKGTITWVMDELDREFTPQQYQNLNELYKEILDIYTFRNNKGNFILCWDHGRFVNHSFKSNCLTTAYDFEIAIRDIQPGEQLTDDYGYLNITEPFQPNDEGTKRKIVYPDDLVNFHKDWDKLIAAVFHIIPEVNQPLATFLSEKTNRSIKKVLDGEASLASILENYYKG